MTLYYEKLEDNKIKRYTGSYKAALAMHFPIIFETEENIVFYNGENYLESDFNKIKETEEYKKEELKEAKSNKDNIALSEVYNTINKGYILYRNCKFESNDANRGNLRDTYEMMISDSQIWLDKDDNQITLTKEEIKAVRACILLNIDDFWNNQYLVIKKEIESASTIEDLNKIEIHYNFNITVEDIIEKYKSSSNS